MESSCAQGMTGEVAVAVLEAERGGGAAAALVLVCICGGGGGGGQLATGVQFLLLQFRTQPRLG
jgi:hypothetical protein